MPKITQAIIEDMMSKFLSTEPINEKEEQKLKDYKTRNYRPPGFISALQKNKNCQSWIVWYPKSNSYVRTVGGACLAPIKSYKKGFTYLLQYLKNEDYMEAHHKITKGLYTKYFRWLIKDSPWADAFARKRIQLYKEDGVTKEKFLLIDCTKPNNFVAAATMAVRSIWEYPMRIKLWEKLVNNGVNPTIAYHTAIMLSADIQSIGFSVVRFNPINGHIPFYVEDSVRQAAYLVSRTEGYVGPPLCEQPSYNYYPECPVNPVANTFKLGYCKASDREDKSHYLTWIDSLKSKAIQSGPFTITPEKGFDTSKELIKALTKAALEFEDKVMKEISGDK